MATNDVYELLNWHVDYLQKLHGDVCVVEYRHEAFLAERAKYASYETTRRNDAKHHQCVPGTRECVGIIATVSSVSGDILTTTNNMKLRLWNMDAFFHGNEARKTQQQSRARMLFMN
jgi:hypothetical protein